MLDRILQNNAVKSLNPDARMRRVHYDWLTAADHTQATVRMLSQQLRRFLDDKARLENRRIMEILRGIEAKALACRELPPIDLTMKIAGTSASIDLPMERPLYSPPVRTKISALKLDDTDSDVDVAALFAHVAVDKALLRRHVQRALQTRSQVALGALLDEHPLQHGLAELVAYLQMAESDANANIDETRTDTIHWQHTDTETWRKATIARVIFSR